MLFVFNRLMFSFILIFKGITSSPSGSGMFHTESWSPWHSPCTFFRQRQGNGPANALGKAFALPVNPLTNHKKWRYTQENLHGT